MTQTQQRGIGCAMKRKNCSRVWPSFLLIVALSFLIARAGDTDLNWRYQLLEGSFLTDDCLVCDRPSLNIPMRGSFMLHRIEVTPIATRYVIENITFQAGTNYSFTGSGTYETSGDFVLRQSMTLTGELKTASGTNQVAFTNETGVIMRRWPMLYLTLKQTNGTPASTITLTIAAAPLREIWFSTAVNYLRTVVVNDTQIPVVVSAGDLFAADRVVVSRYQFPPHSEFINLDAVDILAGGEIAFSINGSGDFAIASSGAITHWQNFMPLIAPGLTSDPGLDALHLEGSNKIYFSTKQDLNGGAIGHGDILLADANARTGGVFRKNADLLALFHPSVVQDYGLDALYIWPNGEIWFSTATGFTDNELGAISDGDLLSDAGYIVYRNADIVGFDDPAANVGLDALFIVSDFAATTGDVSLGMRLDVTNNAAVFSWKASGRVFQLFRAADVTGPWEAVTPIIPQSQLTEPITEARAFYRLRQW
jgi:hypothetical protein